MINENYMEGSKSNWYEDSQNHIGEHNIQEQNQDPWIQSVMFSEDQSPDKHEQIEADNFQALLAAQQMIAKGQAKPV